MEVSRTPTGQVPEPPQLAHLDAEELQFYFDPLPNVWAPQPISVGGVAGTPP